MSTLDVVILVVVLLFALGGFPAVGTYTGYSYGGAWGGGYGTSFLGLLVLCALVVWFLRGNRRL